MNKLVAFIAFLACCVWPASAQSGRVVPRANPTPTPALERAVRPSETESVEVGAEGVVKVETRLINVPVTVMTRGGQYVADLARDEFEIYEDGVQQEIAAFGLVNAPLSLIMMLDISRSGSFRTEDVKRSATAFMGHLREGDQVQVMSFDQSLHVLTGLTADRTAALEAIRQIKNGGRTALYDALDTVMKDYAPRLPTARKAIVLFTDGIDNTSKRATYQSTLEYARELDAAVYVVEFEAAPNDVDNCPPPGRRSDGGGVLGTSRPTGVRLPRNLKGHNYLTTLTEATAGLLIFADRPDRLSRAFKEIADALHSQYSLAYYPLQKGTPNQRKSIRVRVTRPNLAVRNRPAYVVSATPPPVAPSQP